MKFDLGGRLRGSDFSGAETPLNQGQDTYRLYRRLTVLCLLFLLVGAIVGIIVPAGPGWDFANFYDTGRRIAAGQIADLYRPDSLIGGKLPQGNLGFYGSPISALLYTPLSYFSPLWAMAIFKIQNTLACFAALALLYLHNRRFVESTPEAQWRFAALFAFLSLIYQPFWTIYRVGGQATPTVFLLLSLALVGHMKSRFWLSAAFLVAAILIKPAFVFILIPLIFISGWRFARNVMVISALLGVVSLLTLGWEIHEEFLRVMLRGNREVYSWFYNSSLYVVAENLKLMEASVGGRGRWSIALEAGPIAVKLVVLATFIRLLWQGRALKPLEARRHFDFLMASVFSLLMLQTVWEHYLSILFLPLAYVVAARRYFSFESLVLVGSVFALAIWQNLILINFLRAHFIFDSTIELALIGLFKSGPLLLTLIFLWWRSKEFFRSYSAPAWVGGAVGG